MIITPTAKQEKALILMSEVYSDGGVPILAGIAGSGKAMRKDMIIPTPFGEKLFGDLKVGDKIYDEMRNETSVIAISEQGELSALKIKLENELFTYCNEKHLWKVKKENDEAEVLEAKELLYNSSLFKIPVFDESSQSLKWIKIENVEETDRKYDMRCIQVSNSSQLFLSNDNIVTHNSTILKTFTNDILGLDEDEVVYASYTARAAKVLRDKGLPSGTLHSLLYNVVELPNGKTKFVLKPMTERVGSVLVIDELSMVPKEMIEDCYSLGYRLIGAGDPFQIPAIYNGNTLLSRPTFFLDEPHRQALESAIFYWANEIRTKGRFPTPGVHGEELFVTRDSIDDMLLKTDIAICGTNAKRVEINQKIRRIKGYPPQTPVIGDKLVFLRNDSKLISNYRETFINGDLATVKHVSKPFKTFSGEHLILLEVEGGNGDIWRFGANPSLFNISHRKTDFKKSRTMAGPFIQDPRYSRFNEKKISLVRSAEVDFGYCITVHKSQGSEFDKVVLYNNFFGKNEEEKLRMAYTGFTRAKKKLIYKLV